MRRFIQAFTGVLIMASVVGAPARGATTVTDYGTGALVGPLATTAAKMLVVKGSAPLTGYSRAMFGSAWDDLDRNGCDQRDDAITRAALGTATYSYGCVVLTARVTDVYTGRVIQFHRAGTIDHELDIDHVVALADAWKSGISYKSADLRHRLANDPLNLLAVDPTANRVKGDANAASWLPPRSAYRCSYVARQIAVKAKYGLWVTSSERAAMLQVLSSCPHQRLPVGGLAYPTAKELANTGGTAVTATTTPSAHGLDPRFATCALAKAHGYGPYVKGRDPEYYWYRDANHDGIDCQ